MQNPEQRMTTIIVAGKEVLVPVSLSEKLLDSTAVLTAEELAECGIHPGMGSEIRVEKRPPGDYPDKYQR
jgi:hypothetical protein